MRFLDGKVYIKIETCSLYLWIASIVLLDYTMIQFLIEPIEIIDKGDYSTSSSKYSYYSAVLYLMKLVNYFYFAIRCLDNKFFDFLSALMSLKFK